MARRHWILILTAIVLGGGGWTLLNPVLSQGATRRIVDAEFLELEKKLGYHLYAPTWLPHGGRVGNRGTLQGRFRILQDFTDNRQRALAIIAQERRTKERDVYHERRFITPADARADIGGMQGYFVTGSSGERRLFWNASESAIILSSTVMTDAEMVQVARRVR